MTDFHELLLVLSGGEKHVPLEFPEFKPHILWQEGMDTLSYKTRDCPCVHESFGWYFSALLAESDEIVGITIEPFSKWVNWIRKTYPGLGIDGKDFSLWEFIKLSTTEECLFPQISRERVWSMLPRIREFVGIVTIPFHMFEEARLWELQYKS
ncbi:MAG: hypothetical protein IPL87_04515 [Candidatus Moraniibacteriota bacterium]|nr:MAG: hypothetical protein IPL87_04515 [Candidatus Moranbacteria bacterium]